MPLSNADMLLYTTVKLEALSNGSVIGTGTGFFWGADAGDDRGIIFIVTNNHVIDGADHIRASMHYRKTGVQEPSGAFTGVEIYLHASRVVRHPDSSIDLCGILVGDLLVVAERSGSPLFWQNLHIANIPTSWDGFTAIENVLMIGCPRGLYDTANNMPLVRSGITATSVSKSFEGRDEFLVDMACFPGSSGSPVFLFNEGAYNTPQGITLGSRLHFFGVLYAGPLVTNTGMIVLSQAPTVQVSAMMHIGQVIRASQVIVLDQELRRRFVTNTS